MSRPNMMVHNAHNHYCSTIVVVTGHNRVTGHNMMVRNAHNHYCSTFVLVTCHHNHYCSTFMLVEMVRHAHSHYCSTFMLVTMVCYAHNHNIIIIVVPLYLSHVTIVSHVTMVRYPHNHDCSTFVLVVMVRHAHSHYCSTFMLVTCHKHVTCRNTMVAYFLKCSICALYLYTSSPGAIALCCVLIVSSLGLTATS